MTHWLLVEMTLWACWIKQTILLLSSASFYLSCCVLGHFSRVWLFATPWTVACQAPLPVGFFRQQYWIAMPFSRGSSQPRDRTHVSYVSHLRQLGSPFLLQLLEKAELHTWLVLYFYWLVLTKLWKIAMRGSQKVWEELTTGRGFPSDSGRKETMQMKKRQLITTRKYIKTESMTVQHYLWLCARQTV